MRMRSKALHPLRPTGTQGMHAVGVGLHPSVHPIGMQGTGLGWGLGGASARASLCDATSALLGGLCPPCNATPCEAFGMQRALSNAPHPPSKAMQEGGCIAWGAPRALQSDARTEAPQSPGPSLFLASHRDARDARIACNTTSKPVSLNAFFPCLKFATFL